MYTKLIKIYVFFKDINQLSFVQYGENEFYSFVLDVPNFMQTNKNTTLSSIFNFKFITSSCHFLTKNYP